MNDHRVAEELEAQYRDKTLNEADTRHQIIDRILHEVLGWPPSSVGCEKHVNEGYIDYDLKDRAGRVVLTIEAKREGAAFSLPTKILRKPSKIQRVRLKTLATDPSIREAVAQVVAYCPHVGSEYACVTNGHAYILFRSFIRGKDYLDADAIVIPSLKVFSESFTDAMELLDYDGLTKRRSLAISLDAQGPLSRELYYPKNEISHYDAVMTCNSYSRFLEPLAQRFFTDISATDIGMMRNCYVYAQGSTEVETGLKSYIADKLTPFFEVDGGKEISSMRSGGSFAQRIAASITDEKADVIILYGGKGAGKSTFLRRLLYFDPPPQLQMHAFPIVVDFLNAPQGHAEINEFVWNDIVKTLNHEGTLDGSSEDLAALFSDRLEIALRQDLSVYIPDSIDFKKERMKLLMQWRNEKPYVAKRLQNYWRGRQKKPVIIFDNTDQMPPNLQDHCFLVAQNIAREIGCVTVISMREERYCRARTAGVLDAYHNAGFHLASPDLLLVFKKRLHFLISEIWRERRSKSNNLLPEDAPFDEIVSFFVQCLRQFRDDRNALTLFLRECSRDNTRLALSFFRQFITSGYTHVEEMIQNPRWTVVMHQVIKPMMIPDRYNYDENKSTVPDIFQCRNVMRGSHFTGLRILKMLRRGLQTTPEKGGFWRVDVLFNHFESVFGMGRDFELCADIFLRHGIIEANNRLDAFSVTALIDGKETEIFADELRITAFGVYMYDYLCHAFAYLDLTSLDCGLSDQSLYNQFCIAAGSELKLGLDGEKMTRLESRIERVRGFVGYLEKEEDREVSEFLLTDDDRILPEIFSELEDALERVVKSAKRNVVEENGRSGPHDMNGDGE